ncbi:MAG: hypothetical protein GY820_27800 [Gammaproteobacteria bacterium]|nr:hypothetical protein [Gammaproteobacteria bacterium]
MKTREEQLFRVISGGAGVGKSVLGRALIASMNQYYQAECGNLDIPAVLVLAPTGKAAFLIQGNTIHSGLGFQPHGAGGKKAYVPLSDDKRNRFYTAYHNIKVLLVDEFR